MGELDAAPREDGTEPPSQGSYEARLVPVREPFTCAISGRQGSAVALSIRHRADAAFPSLLLDPGAVIEVIRAGMDALDDAVDHIAGPTDVAGTGATGDDSGLADGCGAVV